jgi:hypothetical protein
MTVDLTRLVKPLEWVNLGGGYPHKWEDASGIYRVYDSGKNWSQDRYSPTSLYGVIGRLGQFPDLESAQAAANADNAARVLAAIDTDAISGLFSRLNTALAALAAVDDDAIAELVEAAKEVGRISDRDHAAWHRLAAALAKLKGPTT